MPLYQPGGFVKVEFRNEQTGENEWMWVKVDRADDSARVVFGRLDNEPLVNADPAPRPGDRRQATT